MSSTTETALAPVPKKTQLSTTVRGLLEDPEGMYYRRIQNQLGKRAPQFISSLISLSHSYGFEKVKPTSLIAAGMTAAILDLPIDRNLGFAWIIPYKDLAQFQIGYKGFIQLALRSGRYAGMNALKINQEAWGGYNFIGDPIIKWDYLDETKDAIGYAFAWQLTTGFTKIVYWSKEKVTHHAKRYSQAYKANKKDSPWFTDFDAMALKTVIKNSLSKWGIMSIEDRMMQQGVLLDEGAAIDVEGGVIYPDADEPQGGPPTSLDQLTEKMNGESGGQNDAQQQSGPKDDPDIGGSRVDFSDMQSHDEAVATNGAAQGALIDDGAPVDVVEHAKKMLASFKLVKHVRDYRDSIPQSLPANTTDIEIQAINALCDEREAELRAKK